MFSRFLGNSPFSGFRKIIILGLVFSFLLGINLLVNPQPALAHHAMGGQTPGNFAQGLLSGLAHPIIGLDHLAFVITIGLLAALKNKLGMVISVIFAIATLIGTGVHLLSIDLPFPEVIIAASVLVMGILLAKENVANLGLLISLGAIAGFFHGYAYGESIIGAENTALMAYLLGFCLIQLIISAIAFFCGRLVITKAITPHLTLRFVGFTICGIGATFLSNAVLG
jgi:urease accessory protein